MSSRPEDPNAVPGRGREQRWRPEPEVGPASGGHLAPDVHATGPLFEGLPETEAQPRRRTEPVPRVRRERRSSRSRRRHTVRRVKRTLRHVDPLSIFKLSLFFYALAVLAWLIFVAIVFSIVESTGIFDSIEDVSRGLALGWEVQIDLWFVEKWALLIGLVMWLVGSLLNLLIAFLYNVGADTIGGIEMTFVERDDASSRP